MMNEKEQMLTNEEHGKRALPASEWRAPGSGSGKLPRSALRIARSVLPLLAAFAGLAGAAATAAEPAPAPLLSGCEPDYPPYCIVTPEQQADGFSVELLRAALQTVGREVVFKTGPWTELMQDLAEGRLHALPLVGRTPEREALYDFTFPYLTVHGAIVVREGTPDIHGPADLKGRQVAVMQGDNAEEYLRRADLGAVIVPLPSFDTALRELSAGRHDAVVIQRLVALHLIQGAKLDNLVPVGAPLKDFTQSFCFAVCKENAALLAALNEGLAIVMADGTFRVLHTKWFSALETAARQKSRIVVGGDSDYPPYEFLDRNGQPAGYNVDLTRAIARQMGVTVDIRLKPWSRVQKGLASGEIDVVQGMFYSVERSRAFDFSPPHEIVQHVIVVRAGTPVPSDMAALAGKRILVMEGDMMEELARELGYGDQLVSVPSQQEALRLLAAGEQECALMAKVPALYWIAQNRWNNLRVSSQPVLSAEYCYAVPHGRQALLSEFSGGLAAIKATGEYRQIQTRWLSPYETQGISPRKALIYAAVAILPLLALLFGSLLWSRSLKRQVASRTRELLSERAFLDRIINAIADPVLVKDEARHFVLVNDAFCEIMGCPKEELLGEDDDEMLPRAQSEVFRKMDTGVLDTGEESLNEEELTNRSTGEVRTVVTRKSRYVDPAGKRFIVGVIRDITERKRTEEAMREQQNLASVGTLARGMAHEINNPLNGIMNYAELIKDRVAGNAALAGFAGEILTEGRRVARMTQSLLGFTEQADSQVMALASVADVAGPIAAAAEAAARAEGIALSCAIPAELPPVFCCRSQLEQVVAALLANATEAWEGGGGVGGERKIILSAEVGGRNAEGKWERGTRSFLRLTVADNGPGIPKEIRARLFNPFFTTKDRTQHSGLGLWTSSSIVRKHAGELSVESGEGPWTRFHVELPAGGTRNPEQET